MPNNDPLPGWYPDPQDPGQQRWWDGANWSAATHAVGAPHAGLTSHGSYQADSQAAAEIHQRVPQQGGGGYGPAADPGFGALGESGAAVAAPGRGPEDAAGTYGLPGYSQGQDGYHSPQSPAGRGWSGARKAALFGGAGVLVAAVVIVALILGRGHQTPAAKPAMTATPTAPASPPPSSAPASAQRDANACHRLDAAMTAFGSSSRTPSDAHRLYIAILKAARAAAPGGQLRRDLYRVANDIKTNNTTTTGSDSGTVAQECNL